MSIYQAFALNSQSKAVQVQASNPILQARSIKHS